MIFDACAVQSGHIIIHLGLIEQEFLNKSVMQILKKLSIIGYFRLEGKYSSTRFQIGIWLWLYQVYNKYTLWKKQHKMHADGPTTTAFVCFDCPYSTQLNSFYALFREQTNDWIENKGFSFFVNLAQCKKSVSLTKIWGVKILMLPWPSWLQGTSISHAASKKGCFNLLVPEFIGK